jgi:hypothetical protein
MTKIAGIPEQLDGVAEAMRGTAGDLQALAIRLSSIAYPEMPAGTDATVRRLVGDAGSRLRRDAIVADSSAGDVKKRSAWFRAADTLLAAPLLRAPKETSELLTNALDLKERLRVDQMVKEWNRWNRVVPNVVDDYGEDSMAATRIWFIFQERSPLTHARFLSMLEGEGSRALYAKGADVPFAFARSLGGKVLGPLGVYTNAQILLHSEYKGWRGDVDRAMGGLGMVGSAGATALAFGAAVPGLDVAVGAVLIGVGAWQLGNLAWDNRKAIAHAAVKSAKFAYDHAGWAAGPLGQLAWEHRGDAARVAVGGFEWGVDHGEDIAKAGLGLAKGGLGDATSLGSGVVHHAGDVEHVVVGGLASGAKKIFGGL